MYPTVCWRMFIAVWATTPAKQLWAQVFLPTTLRWVLDYNIRGGLAKASGCTSGRSGRKPTVAQADCGAGSLTFPLAFNGTGTSKHEKSRISRYRNRALRRSLGLSNEVV